MLHQQQRECYKALHLKASKSKGKTTKRQVKIMKSLIHAADPSLAIKELFDDKGIEQAIAGTKTQARHLIDTNHRVVSGLDHPYLRVGSRLGLSATTAIEVAAIRYQRVNNISESDAIAEGVESVGLEPLLGAGNSDAIIYKDYLKGNHGCWSAYDSFATRWQAKHGKSSWSAAVAGKWVWVIEFKAVAK